MALSDPQLQRLADAYGIATEFWDWKGRLTPVSDDTVVAILRALDVDAATPEAATAALVELDMRPWRSALPSCVVVQAGAEASVNVHVDEGASASLCVRLEEGGERVDAVTAYDGLLVRVEPGADDGLVERGDGHGADLVLTVGSLDIGQFAQRIHAGAADHCEFNRHCRFRFT